MQVDWGEHEFKGGLLQEEKSRLEKKGSLLHRVELGG